MSLTGQSGKGKFYLEKIIGYLIPLPAVLLHSYNIFELGEDSEEKKLRNFGHMSKLGVPYLPSSLVWTKIRNFIVYPIYLSKKSGHFRIKVCS